MDTNLISVIIPMYNASQFIRKCITSILNQTYKNFELLIINDGSTDNSLELCNKFKDKRIKVINQENKGSEHARLTGIKQSKGEYICFIDADDWIAKDYLQKLITPAKKYNVDIVCINHYRVLDKYGLIKFKGQWINLQKGLLQSNELNHFHNIYTYNRVFSNTVWGKLYRSQIIDVNKLSPTGIFYGEDLLFNLYVTYNIKSCYLINEYKYYYRYGGYTLAKYHRYWNDSVKLYYEIKKLAIKKSNQELQNIINYWIISIFHWTISYQYKFIHTPTNEIINFINSVFTSKIYNELCIANSKFNPIFITAIKQKDANKILDIIKQDNKSNIPVYKNKILRFLFKILN